MIKSVTTPAVQLENISKRFGSVIANAHVTMDIRHGEILSLLGENGSGKTTLMNMLSGVYHPDEGTILINGEKASINAPKDAYQYGIGMVHQHFKLVDLFTAYENIVLGLPVKKGEKKEQNEEKIRQICENYGFEIDLEKKVYDMTVSEKQTLEIMKVLYRGADILILDEPTAVLTPQETDRLFEVLRNMRADGKAIVIITHKLHEVLEISDRVAILRKGEFVGCIPTAEATPQILTERMVGKKVELQIERPLPQSPELRLRVRHLNVISEYGLPVLHDVSFDVYSGEILGIAGISGCGQKELLESIAGLQKTEAGSEVTFFPAGNGTDTPLIGLSPRQIKKLGISLSFVPEDRLGMGLVGSMGMVDNMMLKNYDECSSFFTNRRTPRELAEKVMIDLDIVTPGVFTPVRRLSGGNVQKVLVGREIASAPSVLMTAYAVRGLDINTSYTIYHLLNEQKMKGVAVIYVGEDLDVLLALSDRILVLCEGQVNAVLDGRTATKEQVGLYMTHLERKDGNSHGA